MEKVIGKRNTEKVAEITMTALGYSITETCICCPCLPGKSGIKIKLMKKFPLIDLNIRKGVSSREVT